MLGYLFGVVLSIGGVGAVLGGDFLIGITLVAMGLVCMPVTFDKISAKINLKPDPKNKRTLIVVLIIVLMIVGYRPDDGGKNIASTAVVEPSADEPSSLGAQEAATLMFEIEEQLKLASIYPEFMVLKERIEYARKRISDAELLARIDAVEQLVKPKIEQMEAVFEADKAKEAEKNVKSL